MRQRADRAAKGTPAFYSVLEFRLADVAVNRPRTAVGRETAASRHHGNVAAARRRSRVGIDEWPRHLHLCLTLGDVTRPPVARA